MAVYYSYDDADRLTGERWYNGPAQIYGFAWDYDPVGNRTHQERNGAHTYYDYDAANALTRRHDLDPDAWTYYAYDPRGNCTRIEEDAGTSYFEYNSRNLVTRIHWRTGVVNTFEYDARGRRTALVDSAGAAYFAYDADGLCQLVERDATGEIVAEYTRGYSSTPGIADLVHARIRSGGTWHEQTHLYDNVGKLMRILRSDGTVVGAFEYDAWGRYLHNAPPPEGTRFGFSAPAWMVLRDAPGGDIILSPTRWYIDEAGRFGQRDPVHSSTNRSRYLLVNPLDGSDATGAWNTEHLTWIRKYDEGKHIPCIIAGSDFVDNNMQKNDPAHGMTTSPSYLPTDAETAASIQQYESFLKSELQQAVTLALQATTPAERGLAMFHLGRAIHAVQDVNTHRGVTIRMHWLAWFKASGEPGTEKLPTMTAHDFDNSRKSPSEQAGKTVYDLFIDNMQAGAGKKKLDNLRKCPCAPHQEGQSDWPVVAPIMGFVMADIKNRKSDILDMEGSNDLRRWLHPWKTASHLQ